MKQFKQVPWAYPAAGAVLLCIFTAALPVICNDDTYIYFNYARSTVAGFPFCYDSRGIPSEGYTSLLYLLMLLPFEALQLNLMWAGIVINLAGMVAMLFWGTKLIQSEKLLPAAAVPPFAIAFTALLMADPNTLEVTGRAMETLPAIAVQIGALYALSRACQATAQTEQGRYSRRLLLFAGLSYLLRPESLPALALAGVVLLLRHRQKGRLLMWTGLLGLALLMYHGGKWLYFHDFFPTGYYRKVARGHVEGHMYLRGWLLAYKWQVLGSGLVLLAPLINSWRNERRLFWMKQYGVFGAALVAGFTLAFFYFVVPMVSYGYRHIFLATVFLYLLLAWGLFAAAGFLAGKINNPALTGAIGHILAAVFCFFAILRLWPNLHQPQAWRLYARAEQATEDFYYLRIGEHLRKNLKKPEQLSLLFGDAGAIPYASRCRLIDPNGLSEPYIARLFSVADSPAKADSFAAYVLRWKPDLIVLPGDTLPGGRVSLAIPEHSPFRDLHSWGNFDSHAIRAWQHFHEAGYRYVNTATGWYYDLHLLVSPASACYDELVEALQTLGGAVPVYRRPGGVSVFNERGEAFFAPIAADTP